MSRPSWAHYRWYATGQGLWRRCRPRRCCGHPHARGARGGALTWRRLRAGGAGKPEAAHFFLFGSVATCEVMGTGAGLPPRLPFWVSEGATGGRGSPLRHTQRQRRRQAGASTPLQLLAAPPASHCRTCAGGASRTAFYYAPSRSGVGGTLFSPPGSCCRCVVTRRATAASFPPEGSQPPRLWCCRARCEIQDGGLAYLDGPMRLTRLVPR